MHPTGRPRFVFLLSIDDLRHDAVGYEPDRPYLRAYGMDGLIRTPTLDALAARGASLHLHHATASYTPPSHASMFTGLYPPRHGVRAFLTAGLSSRVRTLAERLREAGYRTVAAIDFHEIFQLIGCTRGFDTLVRADDRRLWEVLDAEPDRETFLFLHVTDVHPPYGESLCPPDDAYNRAILEDKRALARRLGLEVDLEGAETDRARLVAVSNRIRVFLEQAGAVDMVAFPRYLDGVTRFDGGRLKALVAGLEARGWLERGLCLFTSDHGQMPMRAHQLCWSDVPVKFDHGECVLEQVLRVPLLAVGRRDLVRPGTRVSQLTSMVDVVPTVLEAAGLGAAGLDGVSLLGALGGGAAPGARVVYAEANWHSRADMRRVFQACRQKGVLEDTDYETLLYVRAVTDGRHKLTVRGRAAPEEDLADLDDLGYARACIERLRAERFLSTAWEQEARRLLAQGPLDRAAWRRRAEEVAFRNRALHDLVADPFEEANLLLAELGRPGYLAGRGLDPVVRRLEAELDRLGTDAVEGAALCTERGADAAGVTERLRALGYID